MLSSSVLVFTLIGAFLPIGWISNVNPEAQTVGTSEMVVVEKNNQASFSDVFGKMDNDDDELFPFDKNLSVQFAKTFDDNTRGTLSFSYKMASSKLTVSCKESKEQPNPYKLDYSYDIKKDEEGNYLVNMKGVLNAFDILYVEPTVKQKFTGDYVKYPAELSVGQELPDASTELSTTITSDLTRIQKYKVMDRKVTAKEKVNIGGKEYDAFVITYQIQSVSYLNDSEIQSTTEDIKEWLAPGFGFIKKQSEKKIDIAYTESSVTVKESVSGTKISLR